MPSGGAMYFNNYFEESKGFTLVELMIVLMIAAVLAAISLPTYSEYVRKGKRTAAKIVLMELAQAQEKYYVQNMTYSKDTDDLGLSLKEEGSNTLTKGSEYIVSMVAYRNMNKAACDATQQSPCMSYILEAKVSASGDQKLDKDCWRFTLTNLGEQASFNDKDVAMSHCWGG